MSDGKPSSRPAQNRGALPPCASAERGLPAATRWFDGTGFRVRDFFFEHPVTIGEHFHSDFGMVLQARGGYVQTMRQSCFEVAAGEAVTLPAGELHSEVVTGGSRALLVEWDDPPGEMIPARIAHRLVRARTGCVSATLRVVLSEMRRRDDASEAVIANALTVLLDELSGCPADVGHRPAPWLNAMRLRLDEEFRDKLELDRLAAEAGVSRGHLTRAFRRAFGRSIGDYIRWLRSRHAARCLRRSDEGLARIALDSGFCDQSHLNRVFKEHYGTTPRRYRARAL